MHILELFKLFGTIAVNNSEANDAIDETSEKTESFGSKLKGGISTAAKWGTAIVGGASVAAGSLVKFAESSASTADHIDKMSQKIGIGRQAYQELDFICSQSGTSVDNLQAGMKSLVSAMDGAASGTASNVEQFEKLGISVTNTDGSLRNSEDVMWETLSSLQSMENQTEKARLATELFGRSGTELLPLLNSESGSLEEMRQQAQDLGLVLGDDLIDNGVSLTDTMDQLKRSFGSIVTQLGGALMPIVEKVAKYIIDNMPKIQAFFQRFEPIITSLFEGLLPPLMSLCESLLPVIFDLLETLIPVVTDIIQAILPVIVNLLNMLLPPIVQIIQMILPLLISLIEPLLPLLEPIFALLQPLIDLLMMIIEPLIQLLNMVLPPLIEIISSFYQGYLAILRPILEWLADFLGNVLGGVITAVTNLIGWCADGFKKAWDCIKKAFDPAVKFFKNIWEGIKNAFSSVTDWFKNTFSEAWTGIKNVFSSVGSFFSGIWETIKSKFVQIGTKIGDAVGGAFKKAINAVLKTVENVVNTPIKAINGLIGIINKIPGVNLGQLKTFNLPRLEKGGILPKGKIGLLEGNGAEAVVPLEKNLEWTKNVAKQISDFTSKNNVSSVKEKSKDKNETINITIHIDSFVNQRAEDLKELVDNLSEMLATQFRRKAESF